MAICMEFIFEGWWVVLAACVFGGFFSCSWKIKYKGVKN